MGVPFLAQSHFWPDKNTPLAPTARAVALKSGKVCHAEGYLLVSVGFGHRRVAVHAVDPAVSCKNEKRFLDMFRMKEQRHREDCQKNKNRFLSSRGNAVISHVFFAFSLGIWKL